MMSVTSELAHISILSRCVLVGSACAGLVGAFVGLIVGVFAHPPTAWFAVLELGMPSAIAGAAIGLVVGLIALLIRTLRRGPTVV